MAGGVNETPPPEVSSFQEASLPNSAPPRDLQNIEKLINAELRDVNQQLVMRIFVAFFYALLLLAQNTAIFWLVEWAMVNDKMFSLQPIFGILIAGSLVHTYKISQLIVLHLFKPINYKDKHKRFAEHDSHHN